MSKHRIPRKMKKWIKKSCERNNILHSIAYSVIIPSYIDGGIFSVGKIGETVSFSE